MFLNIPKHRSPGRSPEGKVWFPGRNPGRLLHGFYCFLDRRRRRKRRWNGGGGGGGEEEEEQDIPPHCVSLGARMVVRSLLLSLSKIFAVGARRCSACVYCRVWRWCAALVNQPLVTISSLLRPRCIYKDLGIGRCDFRKRNGRVSVSKQ